MKILYDYQTFYIQDFGGISRLFFELLNSYKNTSIQTKLGLLRSDNHYISTSNDFLIKRKIRHQNWLVPIHFPGKGTMFKILEDKKFLGQGAEKKNCLNLLEENDFDIFHPTYYDDYFFEKIKKPFIITIYDLIHEKFAGYFSYKDIGLVNKKNILEKAKLIIAISENTKKDIIDIYKINPDKIKVTHLANSLVENKNTITSIPFLNFMKNYILFVGNRFLYKNFKKFITAIAPLLKNDLYLIAAGGNEFDAQEKQNLIELGIESRVVYFPIHNDDELLQLYKNASLFVFPSLYEGFGIPILEAFASNCPVACSDTSSLPEVAGNAAFYFDPTNEKSIFEEVKKALSSQSEIKNKIELGQARLENFSWEKTANETLKVYEEAIK